MRRFSVALVLVGVLGASADVAAASPGWSIQRTVNTTAKYNVLNGVSCTSQSACIAVGQSQNAVPFGVAERWDGSKWSIQQTPNTGANSSGLGSVSCTSARACTAIGSTVGGDLAERWDGTTWSIQNIPNPAGAVAELHNVSCTSASACTAVGAYKNRTLAERWDGTKWSIQHTPNPTAKLSFLNDVSCTSKRACTAVGSYYPLPPNSTVGLIERWDGTKWSIQRTPRLTKKSTLLVGVSCSSASACTAVGSYGNRPLAERWDGTKWSIQHPPNPIGGGLNGLGSVSCFAKSACTALGSSNIGGGSVSFAERWSGG